MDVSASDSPFIVYENMTFPTFKEGGDQIFSLDDTSPFFVVCPKGTQSPYLGESGTKMMCKSGTSIVDLEGAKPLDFANIKCRPSKVATVATENEECAGIGVLYRIGFNVTQEFLTLITICFDQTNLTPIYVKYNSTYKEIGRRILDPDSHYEKYICNETGCDWTDSGRMYNDVDIDTAYNNQTTLLDKAGVKNFTLLRLPLALTSLWNLNVRNAGQEIQKIPYYDYINVVPVWNSSHLDALFYMFDTTSAGGGVGPLVWTGTLGVGAAGGTEEVYLSGDKVPVPKWLWMAMDQFERILFYYNAIDGDEEKSKSEIANICSDHEYLFDNMFNCTYESITDTQMSTIIKDLKPDSSS